MSDNSFILVGRLLEHPNLPIDPSLMDADKLYAMFVVITGDPAAGGVHEVVVTPSAANSAWHCISRKIPAMVKGSIKSFPGKKMILLATYVTGYEPANVVVREYFPGNTNWSLPETYLSEIPGP